MPTTVSGGSPPGALVPFAASARTKRSTAPGLNPGSSESTVRSRPLVDGNKRLTRVAVVVIYGINGLALRAPEDPAYELVVSIAEVRLTYPEAAAQLAGWAELVPSASRQGRRRPGCRQPARRGCARTGTRITVRVSPA